jgi:hypothetical protein
MSVDGIRVIRGNGGAMKKGASQHRSTSQVTLAAGVMVLGAADAFDGCEPDGGQGSTAPLEPVASA